MIVLIEKVRELVPLLAEYVYSNNHSENGEMTTGWVWELNRPIVRLTLLWFGLVYSPKEFIY